MTLIVAIILHTYILPDISHFIAIAAEMLADTNCVTSPPFQARLLSIADTSGNYLRRAQNAYSLCLFDVDI